MDGTTPGLSIPLGDAVRPATAIQHVYGDELVTAWGGPGMGTMEIPASQWRNYFPEADHTEYPSAFTCGGYAHSLALRRYFGSDELNWTVSYPAGSTRIEAGITLATHLEMHFATWTDFEESCGQSRDLVGISRRQWTRARRCTVFSVT